jgi:hypothetical protein
VRTKLQWAMAGLVVAGIFACLGGIAVVWTNVAELRAHGLHTVATVQATGNTVGPHKKRAVLLAFTDPDGTPESVWTSLAHDSAKVGDRIAITYDSERVDNLAEGDGPNVAGAWLATVFLLASVAFCGWLCRVVLKVRPPVETAPWSARILVVRHPYAVLDHNASRRKQRRRRRRKVVRPDRKEL